MTTRESNVFQRLKERVCRPEDRFERIENGAMVTGMPDVNYCIKGAEGWIELKAPDLPVREATPLFGSNHKVTTEQGNWFLAQARAGGRGWLFIATKAWLAVIPGAMVGNMGSSINVASAAHLLKLATWQTPVPVKDALIWANLRELLQRA